MYDKISITPKILIISDRNEITQKIMSTIEKEKVDYLFLDINEISDYKIITQNNKIKVKFKSNIFLIDETRLISIYYNITKNTEVNTTLNYLIDRLSLFENVLWIYTPSSKISMEEIEVQFKNAEKINFNVPEVKFCSKIQKEDIHNNQIYDLEKSRYIDYNNQNSQKTSNTLLIHEKIDIDYYIKLFIINNKKYVYVSLGNNCNKIYSDSQNWIRYESRKLPEYIKRDAMKLITNLNLKYGCIHLIKNNNNYYFTHITDLNKELPLLQRYGVNFQLELIKLLIPNYDFIQLKKMIKRFLNELFPFIPLIISNKHIDKEYDELENKKIELSYSSFTDQQKLYYDLHNLVEKDLKRKKSIEDKGKSSLFVFSLIVSVMAMGLSVILNSNWGLFSTLILISILIYLCLAVITTLKTIGGKDYNNLDFDEIHDIKRKESKILIKGGDIKRNISELYKYHKLNQMIILQKINSLYTTFSIVKLTIILMLIFFVNLILTKCIFPSYLIELDKQWLILIRCITSFIILTLLILLSNIIKS